MNLDLKKRLCDPPAQNVASCGDPEVLGLFEGADHLETIENEKVKAECLGMAIEIEGEYVRRRKELAEWAVSEMGKVVELATA